MTDFLRQAAGLSEGSSEIWSAPTVRLPPALHRVYHRLGSVALQFDRRSPVRHESHEEPMARSLPLVTFERYMLAEDTVAYPRVFILEVTLSGSLRREALEAAWPAALARHPMLTARLDERGQNWIWPEDHPPAPAIDWGQESEPLTFRAGQRIDLAREPGLRLWVRTGPAGIRLVFQFHHACCDGIGGLEFIGDLLALYAHEATGGDGPPLLAVRADLLAQRGSFGLTKPTLREWLRDVAVTAAMSFQLLSRTPVAAGVPISNPTDPEVPMEFPGIESHTFSPGELDGLRQTARQTGATLNDLMMAYLFCALVDWNALGQSLAPREWLRMNVPTSLRRQADEEMPAANVMSFAFVDRRAGECAGGARLVESIRDEMEAIRRLRLSLYFIGQIGILAAIPGAMRRVLGLNRCFASAVLTNVGDPVRRFRVRFPRRDGKAVIGNLLLENIVGVPPLRALTRVGVALTSYAGQLTVSVLCDRHCFSRGESRHFLEIYLHRIGRGLAAGVGEGEPLHVDRGAAVND
jgi:hypothetical protein